MSREAPMHTRDGAWFTPGLYVQDGRTLYKVSTVYDTCLTATLCMHNGELPRRTTVRRLGRRYAEAALSTATDRIVDQYHAKLDAGNQVTA